MVNQINGNAISVDETKDRSDRAHDLIDLAVLDLRELGLAGVAPWRAMAWTSFLAIREESSAADAVADLTRLRDMLDKHLLELASGVPQ